MKRKYVINVVKSCALSITIILLCYSLVYYFGSFAYLSNDDTSIQTYLSGITTGSPYPAHQFINIFLGQFVANLYIKNPNIQWWFVLEHIILIVGMYLINFNIFYISYKNNHNIFTVYLIQLFLNIIFIMYSIDRISFTIAPSVFGTGLICSALSSKQLNIVKIFGLLSLSVICSLYRKQTGLIVLAFLIAVIIYRCIQLKHYKKLLFSIIVAMFTIYSVMAIIKYSDKYLYNINGEDFYIFNSARTAYKDYPHDTYYNNQKIYDDVGWDEVTYKMALSWCFMDEKITTDSFVYLHENSKTNTYTEDIIDSRISIINKLIADNNSIITILSWLIIAIVVMISIYRKKPDIISILFILFTILISFAMLFYLVYKGRAIYRSIVIILLPSLFILLSFYLKHSSFFFDKKGILLIIILLILSTQLSTYLLSKKRKDSVDSLALRQKTLYGFGFTNSEKLYIREIGVTDDTSPRMLYPDRKPTNVLIWGGSTWYSDAWKKRLAANNIEKLDYTVFLGDDTYFVSKFDVEPSRNKDNTTNGVYYMYHLLEKHEYDVYVKVIDKLYPDMIIYKFLFNEAPDTYIYDNGWKYIEYIEEEHTDD